MKNVMGIIYHHKNENMLRGLTAQRCLAAVPYAGNYRLVDFILSALVNAGVGNIGVITDLNMRSLVDHLGKGKEWGLERKKDGLFILPAAAPHRRKPCGLDAPPVGESPGDGPSFFAQGIDLQDLDENIDYLLRSRQEYVIICGCNIVSRVDLEAVFRFHREEEADITIVGWDYGASGGEEISRRESVGGDIPRQEIPGQGILGPIIWETGADRCAKAVHASMSPKKGGLVGLDLYLLRRELLLEILENCRRRKKWDLVQDVLRQEAGKMHLAAYKYQGYLAVINSVASYYRHQMQLLKKENWESLFFEGGPIYTKMKDSPPSQYLDSAEVRNSMVANGCIIQGLVENSILFRGVKIAPGAVVKNSIVMAGCLVEEDAVLEGVILDKKVLVRKGSLLMGDQDNPLVIKKQSVV